MDSESYLVKIIQSGTKHTQDSLYLQTTIGQGIRWPIVLLISTAVGALAVFLCLVWTMVRRPRNSFFKSKNFENDDSLDVIVTSSPSSLKNSQWPNKRLDFEAHFFNDLIVWPSQIHESHSELNLHVDERSPLLAPKKMVSWASADSISIIPRENNGRRYSYQSGQFEAGTTSKNAPRRYPVEGSPKASSPILKNCNSPVASARACISKNRTSSPIDRNYTKSIDHIPVMKPNRQSEIHLQISKTIAVLDDLNKSLQSSHRLTEFTRSAVALQRSDSTAVDKSYKQKLPPSPVKNVEKSTKPKEKTKLMKTSSKLLKCAYGKPSKRGSILDKHISIQDAKEIVELQKLLDAEFDQFQGQ